MRSPQVPLLILFIAVLVSIPALQAVGSSAFAVPPQESQPPPETGEYTSPQGVSPADPDAELPNPDGWECPRCGHCVPFHRRGARFQKRLAQGTHHPMLGPQAGRGGPGGRRGALHRSRRGGRGPGHGLAADRMLRHAADLGLSDVQIGQLETLSFDAKKRLIELKAEVRMEELEMKQEIRSGDDNMTRIKKHLSSLAQKRAGIQETKIANWIDSRKILTEDQKGMIKKKFPRLGRMLD